MKIGIAVLRLAELQSGSTESIYALASQLEKKGLEIIFLLPKLQTKIPFKTKYFGSSKVFHRKLELGLFTHTAKYIIAVKKFAKEVDIVHVVLPTPAFSFIGDIIKFRINKTVIVSFDSILYKGVSLKTYIKHPLMLLRATVNSRPVARLSNFFCDHYIVSTNYQKRRLVSLNCPAKKIRIIPNMFNCNKLNKRKRSRKILGLNKKKVVSYLGHLNWHKGADLFIRAIPLVLKEKRDVVFVLAWSTRGSKHSILQLVNELKLSRNITILGRIDVKELYLNSAVLVLPYRVGFGTQSYPNTILEAFYLGTPLVSTNVIPIRELFQGNKKALTVEPGDIEGIASAIPSLLNDKRLANKMRDSQRKFIHDNLLPDFLVEKYINDVYKKQ